MREIPNAEQLVGRYWPRYGPYCPEHTATAVDAVGELVRYLAYATGQGADQALPSAASLYTVVGGLRAAAGGLEQTLRQLAARTGALHDDPALGHCEHRGSPAPVEHQAARLAAVAAGESLTAATQALSTLCAALNTAQSQLAWLYHREQGAGDE